MGIGDAESSKGDPMKKENEEKKCLGMKDESIDDRFKSIQFDLFQYRYFNSNYIRIFTIYLYFTKIKFIY